MGTSVFWACDPYPRGQKSGSSWVQSERYGSSNSSRIEGLEKLLSGDSFEGAVEVAVDAESGIAGDVWR